MDLQYWPIIFIVSFYDWLKNVPPPSRISMSCSLEPVPVTFNCKKVGKGCGDVIKLRNLRCETILDFSRGRQRTNWHTKRTRQVKLEKTKIWGCGHKPRNPGSHHKPEEARNRFYPSLPRETPKGVWPCSCLDFSRVIVIWDFGSAQLWNSTFILF